MSIIRIDTKGGNPHAVIEPVVAKLLEKQLVVKRPDGTMYTDLTEDDLVSWVAELGVCDFCNETSPKHVLDVPDFDLPTGMTITNSGVASFSPDTKPVISEHGWAACDECYALVVENHRTRLLQRAVERAHVGKFGAAAIKELHRRFWQARDDQLDAMGIGAALSDYVDDKIPDVRATLTDRGRRIESIRRLTGLTNDEVEALQRGDTAYKDVAKKLVAWKKRYGTDYDGARRMAELIERGEVRPPVVGGVPHWQRALDEKFRAAEYLTKALRSTEQGVHFPQGTELGKHGDVRDLIERAQKIAAFREMNYATDIKQLKVAQAYSFNAETAEAIRAISHKIPHEAPLSSIDVPTGTGWFWFSQPLDIACSPMASPVTNALLWGWDNQKVDNPEFQNEMRRRAFLVATPEEQEVLKTANPRSDDGTLAVVLKVLEDIALRHPNMGYEVAKIYPPKIDRIAMRFSAYVVDQEGVLQGDILPSTRWYWPLELSLHDMLAFNTASYRASYGEGGRYVGSIEGQVGEEQTLKCVAELSLFFLSACMWFKQKILVTAPGHVERHARKRLVREHKLKEPPTVQVIALRKAMRPEDREHASPTDNEAIKREYSHRWIVGETTGGFPRLQVCGPGRADRKLIWISPYPAGPDDKPLRTRQKVYAVVR